MAQTVACPSCRAPTEIDPAASQHQCRYCSFQFVFHATHEAAGEAERKARELIEPVRQYLDSLQAHAREAMTRGDETHARSLIGEYVAQMGLINRESGSYQLLGLLTEADIGRYEENWIEMELAGARPADTLEDMGGNLNVQFGDAMTNQDFPAMVAAYVAIQRRDLPGHPDWQHKSEQEITLAIEQAVTAMAINTPWATAEELASVGVKSATPTTGSDGRPMVQCGYCSASISLEVLTESIQCPFCEATTCLQLSGAAVYHARGHHDVTEEQAAGAQAAQQASARHDVDAALAAAQGMVQGATPGSPVYREKLYYYAAQMYGWLGTGDAQAEALSKLGLGAPVRCSVCEETSSRAMDGSGKCPVCGS